MSSRRVPAVLAGWAPCGEALLRDALLEIDAAGRITAVGPRGDRKLPPGTLDLRRRIVVPGTCNTHSHAFQVLLRGRCEAAGSFREWVDRYLYPMVQVLGRDDVAAAARLAFSEMLACGTTLVGEFHYLHRDPGGGDAGNAYAEAILEAASDVGLRTCLLRALYDVPGRPGRERFVEPVEVAVRRLDELADLVRGRERITVGAAPHSLHGASAEAIRAGHAWSAARGTPMHVHLAEQQGDLDVARRLFGATPLRALESLGVVDERLVIVHGCWLDDGEWRALGRARGGLAYNPSSNMALGDGVTDVAAAVAAGVRVSLGTDGACANNEVDVFREMRAAEHLQRVTRLRMGVLTAGRGGAPLVEMGTVNGYRNLGLAGGAIAAGELADLVALDADDPSLQPLELAGDGREAAALLASQLAFALSPRGAVTDVLVGGVPALADRRPLGVDPAAVAAEVRRLRPWTRAAG